ncbi:MAG: GNAT family N-acetyltransferase [Acidimicrobiales bacterium]
MELDPDMFAFETERLRCGPWIEEARQSGVDLASVVAGVLTPTTTVALPAAWRGAFTIQRARAWIEDREADSTALLVTDRANRAPIGLAILAALPAGDTVPTDASDPDTGPLDLRIGYMIYEAWWGRGIATELVKGLVDRARSVPDIVSVTGGVDQRHEASIRVLERSGFRLQAAPPERPRPDPAACGTARRSGHDPQTCVLVTKNRKGPPKRALHPATEATGGI